MAVLCVVLKLLTASCVTPLGPKAIPVMLSGSLPLASNGPPNVGERSCETCLNAVRRIILSLLGV